MLEMLCVLPPTGQQDARELSAAGSDQGKNMSELSDEERLLLVDRVDELQLNDTQKSILSDKAMNCRRGDADFVKLKTLGTFWRRHREGLVSYANFSKQVDKACGLPQEQQQQQHHQHQQHHHHQQQIPAGGEEEEEDDADTVMELGDDDDDDDDEYGNGHSNGANHTGNHESGGVEKEHDEGSGSAGGSGAGGEEDEEDSDEDDADPETKQFVDEHMRYRGFLVRHLWRTGTSSLECPGEGYWEDQNNIKLVRDSTAHDMKVAEQATFPTHIPHNPLSQKAPKAKFDSARRNYNLLRKVAVSHDGVVYRATDDDVRAALKADDKTPAGFSDPAKYVKVVRETRRRHRIARKEELARTAAKAARKASSAKRLRSR